MAQKDADDAATQDEPETSVAVNDAWTGLLAISLLALAIGAGFLAYDYMQYSDQEPPKGPKFTPPAAVKKADDAPAAKVDPKGKGADK